MDHPTTPDGLPIRAEIDDALDLALDRIAEQRTKLRTRHSHALTTLMEERRDLRGVNALADLVDDSIRWSA